MAGVTQDPEAWARLGTMIRERREEFGLSRRQLSEAAGVSEKSIQVAEEGRTPRARWPQSLRLIEAALSWAPGSMQNILEGGDPAPFIDQESLFPASFGGETEVLPGADEELPTNHTRSKALARLPKSLRVALEEVLVFGRKASNHGADDALVEDYERAVDALIIDLTSRPAAFIGYSHDPGHLARWRKAMRMDPMLRRQREERTRSADRESRRMREREADFYRLAVERTQVADETGSDMLRAIRVLSEEIARLSRKIEKEDKKPSTE